MKSTQSLLVFGLVLAGLFLAPASHAQTPAKRPTRNPVPTRGATKPVAQPATSPTATESNTWVLLVGVGKYDNPQITSLKYPAIDATGLRDMMADPKLGNIPASHIRLLTDKDATAANILGAVDTFLKPNVKPGAQVVVFLAGHGVAKGVGLDAKSYLLPSDVRGLTTASLDASAVNLRTLSAKLSELPASQFFIFVDACREDPTPGRGVKGNALTDVLSRGVQITPTNGGQVAQSAAFFACSVGQRAFEDPSLSHGVFTYYILDAIQKGDIPRKPDGAIDMGVLASYVRGNVGEWAKRTSARGDYEVEQTPEFVTGPITAPMVLMRVHRALPDTVRTGDAPILIVESAPAGAAVSVDGQSVGATPLRKTFADSSEHTVKVEAAGYTSVERKVMGLAGYSVQIAVSLPPGARASGNPTETRISELYAKGQQAEARQQWEVAQAAYDLVMNADPTFAPAYERLADLQTRRRNLGGALETLIRMVTKTPPTAHGYSLLARAYAPLAAEATAAPKKEEKKRGGLGGLLGKMKRDNKKEDGSGKGEDMKFTAYVIPKSAAEARMLARHAAEEAVRLEPGGSESQIALGFALVAGDRDGSTKEDALGTFGKAVLLAPADATGQYGLGFGIRYFAQYVKGDDERKAEIKRAMESLQEALRLRPDYYEAHRELAYCYHLLDDLPNAEKEYVQADARRGSATDDNDVAAVNLSLSAVLRQMALKTPGGRSADLLAASGGYLAEAKEITPNLSGALFILNRANLSPRLENYLPSDIQRMMRLPDTLRDRFSLPGGLGFPRFP